MPAFGRLRSQALIFTPYLIHGLTFNKSDTRTRMALEMRFQIAR